MNELLLVVLLFALSLILVSKIRLNNTLGHPSTLHAACVCVCVCYVCVCVFGDVPA